MRRVAAGALLVLVAAWAAGEEAAGTARIAGKITPPEKVTKVGVVERNPATLMKLHDRDIWGHYDPKTGEYAVEKLAAVDAQGKPRRYDLLLQTPEARIEGVHLAVRDEEKSPTYDVNCVTGQLTTQRADVSKYFEEGQVVTPEERDKMLRRKLRIERLEDKLKKLLSVASFNDTSRVLYIHGTPERATVLLEFQRKTAFYAEKADEIIWRIESYPFEWAGDVWNKTKPIRVWQRQRMPAAQFARLGYVFAPALGGIEVQAGETTKFDVTLPEKIADLPGTLPKP